MAEPTPTPIPASSIDTTFTKTTNLTSSLLNAVILSKSDDFFASADNLLTPTPPIHRPGVFVHTGAWYDGWETRRHNPGEFDWAVIKLGVGSGVVVGVEIDTAYFVGNYGEKVLIEGTCAPEHDEEVSSESYSGWKTILPIQPCGPSQRQAWKLSSPSDPITHVRVRMYPDGGFARVRLYGHAIPPPLPSPTSTTSDPSYLPEEELSSALLGALVVSASNQHFTPASNLLLPGRGKNMGDGWETARSRERGHVDWAIVRLAMPARSVGRVVVDTKDFRGNFPRGVRVHGMDFGFDGKEGEEDPAAEDGRWSELVGGEQPCRADEEHVFEGEMLVPLKGEKITHVKLTMVPDGGIKRFRVFGQRMVLNK